MKLYQIVETALQYNEESNFYDNDDYVATYGIFSSYEKAKSELFRLFNSKDKKDFYYSIEDKRNDDRINEQFVLVKNYEDESDEIISKFDIIEFELDKASSTSNPYTYYDRLY